MINISTVMGNKRFAYLIVLTFIADSILLIGIQLNSARNTKELIKNNKSLLHELRASNHLREIDRDILGVESRIRASIATNDTTHLEGIDQKINQVENFLDSLSKDNTDVGEEQLIRRLSVLALDKKIVKERLLLWYHTSGNMDDQSSIANPRARKISNEITSITAKINKRRQLHMIKLGKLSEEMGEKSKTYDICLLVLLVLSGAVIGYHIVRQFRRQHILIKELNAAEKLALMAAQTKENFLANMSHEIRTPLSGILGFTNLLLKRPLDSTAAEFVSTIQRSGENLMAIVNDILDLSKIEAGMVRITPGTFSINGLTNSVETLFSERIKEKGLQISSEVDISIPDTLIGDATRLTQILVNLIGNAIKFTHKGKVRIQVYNKERKGTKILVGFKVSDTGIGIEKEKLKEVFERFNQGEDSTTRNFGGTGLGLSIAKSLILLQEGNIQVNSVQGKGTTFDFFIPYGVSEEQLNLVTSKGLDYFKDKGSIALRILVVDDNNINQSLMEHLLLQWNINFDIVSNGLEAIQQLANQDYDLVLMDIQMPQMDGYAATQHIRDVLKSEIPIIAMTAHALAGEREKCLSRGMNDYISKPIKEDELFKLISNFGLEKNTREAGEQKEKLPGFKYLDLTYMRSISGGKKEFEETVTRQFIDNIPIHLDQLTNAYQAGNFKIVNIRAHDLKTTIAMMGILGLLEDRLDQMEMTMETNAALDKVLIELSEVLTAATTEAKLFLNNFK
jgi:signal transduction histidine kinase/DNA-binding response OmpR family regulator